MFLIIGLIGLGLFVAFGVYLYLVQDKMVFFPARELEASPADINLSFEEVLIPVTATENIHGWYIPAFPADPESDHPVVLFFHGNGGNISHRLPTVEFLTETGADVFMIDYRGYGRSDGRPSEKNMYEDASAAYRWLIGGKEITPERIVLFGRSLGGAVAIDLASRVECGGLIVESSFSSAVDMGRMMFPYFPVSLLVKHRFESISKITRVKCPILITHSRDDEMVPFRMGRALYDKARTPKKMLELTGGHNDRDYMGTAAYRKNLENMLIKRDFTDWRSVADVQNSHRR